MNTKIDLKSALVGLGAGVLATLAIGAASMSNPTGRFQIAGALNYFLIVDTTTGKVWTANMGTSGMAKTTDAGFFDSKVEQ